MGWKSSKGITREHAISLIAQRIYDLNLSDEDLCNAVEAIGYGENTDLPHYGYNFFITDKNEYEENYDEWPY